MTVTDASLGTEGSVLHAPSPDERKQYAKDRVAMPDGSLVIRNRNDLIAAIRMVGRHPVFGPRKVKNHIVRRARAIGLVDELPQEWNVTQELTSVLTLEHAGIAPQILQEPSADNGEVMRVKVPFYVGGSVSNAPGFKKRIFWPENILEQIVQEGNAAITDGKQPLTVYARHAHATSGRDLPCGAVVALEHDGRVGYSTIEVAPTSVGKDVQALARARHLNAVSLRARDFSLADGKVNGENVLVCERLGLAGGGGGIDFAPDSPAQPTYGIQILNEQAHVEMEPTRSSMPDTVTLEDLRKDHAQVLQEVERPLKDRISQLEQEVTSLKQENDGFKEEKAAAELRSFITEIAGRTNDPKAFGETFTALCQEKGIKDVASATPLVTPLLLQALDAARNPQPTKSREELLREMFPQKTGAGAPASEPEDTKQILSQEDRVYRTTVGGLVLPE